jgi:D-3-phosphoglycerate dehydrogenase
LGHGHIGSLLKNSLTPLAQEVRIYDPYAGFTNLDLNNIDVLIPACSLNKKNTHFIDKNFLLKLNEDFLLINAARGSLIHTQNLLDVLKNRPEAYAILDVFEKEPCNFENIYKEVKNISLTSHIAGVYKNIDAATAHFEASMIFDFINLENSLFENKYKNLLLKNRLFHQDLI